DRVQRLPALDGALTIEVAPANLLEVARTLREEPQLRFEMLMDLAAVDFLDYGRVEWRTTGATSSGFSRGVSREAAHSRARPERFAVVLQLLSVTHNHRLSVRVYCEAV